MLRSIDDIKSEHLRSDPRKLLPSTITFLRELRAVANSGRRRRGEPEQLWTAQDEERF